MSSKQRGTSHRSSLWLANIVVVLLVISACGGAEVAEQEGEAATTAPESGEATEESGVTTEAPTGNDVLRIGAFLPLSGATAHYGGGADNAARIAVDEINSAGGVDIGGDTYTVELITYDDAADPDEAASALERLVTVDDVKASLGTVSSTGMFAAMEVAERRDIVVISPFASSPDLTTGEFEYFFRGGVIRVTEWEDLPPYWVDQGWTTAAFLSLNDDYGQSNSEGLAESYEAAGGEVVGTEFFSLEQEDFYALLQSLSRTDATMLSTSSQTEQAGLIARQAHEVWPDVQLVMSGGLDPVRLVEIAGAEALEGMIFATPEPAPTEERLAFDAEYESRYGETPFWGYSKGAYDNMHLLVQAFQDAGTVDDPEALRQALIDIEYEGLLGTYDFDETGENFLPWYYARMEDGEPVIFDPRATD